MADWSSGLARGVVGVAVGAALATAGAPAGAQQRVTDGAFYRDIALVRLNPLGLINDLRVGYRRRIFTDPGRGVLLRGTYASLAASAVNTPAFARPGVVLEVQPLAVLNLWAAYEHTWYFGNFDFVQSYRTAGAPHGDGDQDTGGANGQNYVTSGHLVTLGATLQAKVRDVALRTAFRFVYNDLDLRGGERFFYDMYYDIMAPNRGWMVANDTDLIYQSTDLGINVGLRYSLVHALYPGDAYGPGEARDNTPIQRLGPLFTYTFSQRRHAFFNAPTVFVIANWWLAHRYRTGDPVSGALPYLVVGFSFRGDA